MASARNKVLKQFNRIPGDIRDALTMLEWLGSDQDPIEFQGREIDARQLECLAEDADPSALRISYAGGSPGYRRIRGGTLIGMIADRILLHEEGLGGSPRRPSVDVLAQLLNAELSYPKRLKLAAKEIRRLRKRVEALEIELDEPKEGEEWRPE